MASIFANLRLLGEEAGKAENIRVQFNRLMLESIRKRGRITEADVLLKLNLGRFKTRLYPVAKKGVVSVVGRGVRDKSKIRRIFDSSWEVKADD
ncbi:MAG TPA: hypothetical protein VNU93_07950 [Verrucomicrobiae bacterium]|nr:hypothetical protein [Verrucomicrobiae bacterium]